MNSATYPTRNLFRRKGRTIGTIVAIALGVLIFCVLRTFVAAFNVGVEDAAKDRIATRHKVSITMQLPKRYIEDVRALKPAIVEATWANWFDGKDPKERSPFFAAFAADHETWFTVMDEMQVDPAQLAAWKQTRNGVILGELLAKTLEVKVGDRLVITSGIYPGDWEFQVVGIYKALRRNVDRNTLIMRWDYFNDDPRSAVTKDQIGWVMSKVADANASPEVQKKIDKMFDERDDQTVTMSEKAFNLSFLGGFAAVLGAFDLVSLVILLILVLILANTVAMSVRERTHEYGVLRAIGFAPGNVLVFIVAESLLIAFIGGVAGVLITLGLINGLVGPAIEQSTMGAMFPYVKTPLGTLGIALGAATVLGAIAGLLPGYLATRKRVTDALRRID